MPPADKDFTPLTLPAAAGSPAITVRTIRPEDEQAFHAAFLQLSSESRYSRFMSVVRDLSEATLDRATNPDGQREFALVASVPDAAGERIVAGARFVAVTGQPVCEFAVTVVDGWQGHGLGRALLTSLKEAAASRGYARMEGYVLSTNLAMRRLGQRLGFADGPMPDDATTRLLVTSLGEGSPP
jgi:GNAT superfamily N-acetyltransferase